MGNLAEKLITGQAERMSWEEFNIINSQDEIRREYYDGTSVRMDAPTEWHQDIVSAVTASFFMFLRGKPCKFFPGRDIHLKLNKGERLYVPDGLVLCDRSKDTGKRIEGAPDFVLEVWSRANVSAERKRKVADYKEAGVREIWEVVGSHDDSTCIQHVRKEDGSYDIEVHYLDEPVTSKIFIGCVVDFTGIDVTE